MRRAADSGINVGMVLRTLTSSLVSEELLLEKLSVDNLYPETTAERDKKYELQPSELKCILASERFTVSQEIEIEEPKVAAPEKNEEKSDVPASGAEIELSEEDKQEAQALFAEMTAKG